MSVLAPILVLVIIGLVVLVVGAPIRRARRAEADDPELGAAARPTLAPAHARDELEAAREAKYREIRDTELDFRTGKLSPEDYAAIDTELRAEAIEILDGLERLNPRDA
jgi:hypothetical protein